MLDQSQLLFSQILDLLSSSGRKIHQQASIQLSKDAVCYRHFLNPDRVLSIFDI